LSLNSFTSGFAFVYDLLAWNFEIPHIFNLFFSKSTAFKLFLKPLKNYFAQIKPQGPFYPHSYHFFPFHLAKTSKQSWLKTCPKFKVYFPIHLVGQNHSTTMLSHYCIFACLLNIFPSPSKRFAAPLPHCWRVRVSHRARPMGPSLVPVLHQVGIAYALHIFFSVSLFPQRWAYLTQTRSSQPSGSGDNSFQSLFPLIYLLVRFRTGHKTLPITGQIRDIPVSSQW